MVIQPVELLLRKLGALVRELMERKLERNRKLWRFGERPHQTIQGWKDFLRKTPTTKLCGEK
jgi:hypothetical protein